MLLSQKPWGGGPREERRCEQVTEGVGATEPEAARRKRARSCQEQTKVKEE